MREVSAELRKSRGKEQLELARRTMGTAQAKLSSDEFQAPPQPEGEAEPVDDGEIRVGDKVHIRGTNAEATVLSVPVSDFQIQVQCGQTKLWLGVDTVDRIAGTSRPQSHSVSIKASKSDRYVARELDLRGRRADEIEPALDTYLNAATVAAVPSVCIIHGFGTGTVRNIVREYAAASRLVRSFRPGQQNEGGDGVTIVEL